MRILQVISSLAGGGAERLVAQIAPLINETEALCDVLTLSDSNAIYLTSLKEKIAVHISPYKNRNDIRILFFIIRLVKYGKYDIVHAHTFPAIYWTSLAARFVGRKVKFLMTEHNTHNRRREKILLKPLEKYIYRRYDTVISISEETKKALLQWLSPRKAHKYIVIENGIDIKSFRNAEPLAREALDVPNESVILGMVGSFTRQKNHETLANALALLHENVHIIFLGEGSLFDSIVELTKTLDVYKRSHFLGFRTDVASLMKAVDIVVIPSLWEGFGLVAAEAMACGKPVACSDVPGLREVVGDCAVLFDPNNAKDIAEKITLLINDKQLSCYNVTQASTHAEKYSIESMTEEYIKVYSRYRDDEFKKNTTCL